MASMEPAGNSGTNRKSILRRLRSQRGTRKRGHTAQKNRQKKDQLQCKKKADLARTAPERQIRKAITKGQLEDARILDQGWGPKN